MKTTLKGTKAHTPRHTNNIKRSHMYLKVEFAAKIEGAWFCCGYENYIFMKL